MGARVFVEMMSLSVLLVTAMCFVRCSAQAGCTPAIAGLSPCLAYMTSNSSKPSDSCCAQVAAVVQTQAQCLCSFLGSATATRLGSIINQAQSLSLPGACKIDNPLANQCNAATSSQTPAAQSPQEAVAPASPETPSGQSPTAATSPSSFPIIPAAGSGKAGQSSAAGASAKFMPFVFFLALVASSASILPVF